MSGIANLMGGGGQKVAPPVKQEVVKMPDRQDPALLSEAERKRKKVQEDAGGGRDQTMLTSGEPIAYGNKELGK